MQHALRIKHYTLLEPQYEYLYSEVISWCKATRVVTATALVVDISLEDRLTKHLVAFLEPRYEAKSESLQYYSPAALIYLAIFRLSFSSTVTSAMYVLAVVLTPVAVVMLILLLLRASQPQAPIIIVHLQCTCSRLVQEEPDDEQDEDYWHTPVQETQHPQ